MKAFQDPIKTIRRSAPLSLLLVAILYMLCNVAYFAAGKISWVLQMLLKLTRSEQFQRKR